MQKNLKGGQQRHEESGLATPTEILQAFCQLCAEPEELRRAVVGLMRWPWSVKGQTENRQLSCQLSTPILPEPLALRTCQKLSLPVNIINILKLKRSKRDRRP